EPLHVSVSLALPHHSQAASVVGWTKGIPPLDQHSHPPRWKGDASRKDSGAHRPKLAPPDWKKDEISPRSFPSEREVAPCTGSRRRDRALSDPHASVRCWREGASARSGRG